MPQDLLMSISPRRHYHLRQLSCLRWPQPRQFVNSLLRELLWVKSYAAGCISVLHPRPRSRRWCCICCAKLAQLEGLRAEDVQRIQFVKALWDKLNFYIFGCTNKFDWIFDLIWVPFWMHGLDSTHWAVVRLFAVTPSASGMVWL